MPQNGRALQHKTQELHRTRLQDSAKHAQWRLHCSALAALLFNQDTADALPSTHAAMKQARYWNKGHGGCDRRS